ARSALNRPTEGGDSVLHAAHIPLTTALRREPILNATTKGGRVEGTGNAREGRGIDGSGRSGDRGVARDRRRRLRLWGRFVRPAVDGHRSAGDEGSSRTTRGRPPRRHGVDLARRLEEEDQRRRREGRLH